ncbi:transcriptional regulator AsnC family [Clostridium aceticum]|uniref:siroheme decarboxylase n=1 Tax=Clostridium aceticum TaxID=84022 RepID=A0A0D8IBT6_9CLOT|nr:Lrp/AsnC family transcriptional regulator [Clostridium aceticum]AKL96804.1 transcriptional regulator AsnC family [Clostridium aceticum]KJF27559.1 transcriptional regulator [Clostridium aceticum]
MELTELDKKIIRLLQEEIPLAPEPYKVIAEILEIEEAELLKKIQEYREKGILRRVGAVLRHRKAGFTANAMVVWEVEPHRTKEVGDRMATFSEVTHCYERPTYHNWPYNLFTMIHGTNQEVCYEIAEELSQAVDVKNYKLLFSSEELKKTSMKYFCV